MPDARTDPAKIRAGGHFTGEQRRAPLCRNGRYGGVRQGCQKQLPTAQASVAKNLGGKMSVTCHSCGSAIEADAAFCPECGAKQERHCISCGAVLEPGAAFCGECGTAVASDGGPDVGVLNGPATSPRFPNDDEDDEVLYANQRFEAHAASPKSAQVNRQDEWGSRIGDFVREISSIDFDGKGFAGDAIPLKKLAAALESYGHGLRQGDVLFLVDTTVFGGAKEGLIVSSKGLYAKDIAEKPTSVLFENIREVAFKKGLLDAKLFINGIEFMAPTTIPSESIQQLCEKIQDLVAG